MLFAEMLAELAADTGTIADATRTAAVRAVLDLLTSAVAGQRASGTQAEAARRSWGPGSASVWFADLRLSVPGAAFANSAAASALEAAQYSIPFCVALALVRGADALLPMLDGT